MVSPCALEKIQRKSVLAVIDVSVEVHLRYQAIDDIDDVTDLQKALGETFFELGVILACDIVSKDDPTKILRCCQALLVGVPTQGEG